MKYIKLAIGVLIGVAASAILVTGVASAQLFRSQPDRDKVVNGSIYTSGNEIVIRGVVNGDVFCAGQTIRIEAVVNGDVLCAGRTISLSGQVNGDVRLAANTVRVRADVDRGATVAGVNITFEPGSRVGRDLTMNGNSQTVRGQVGRDLIANGADVVLGSVVGRNVQVDGAKLQLTKDAAVGGDLSFSESGKLERDRGAQIQGEVTRPADQRKGGILVGGGILMYLILLAGLVLLGLLLAWLFPRLLRTTAAIIQKSVLKTLLVGLIASIAVPVAALLLSFTLIGIPVAIALVVGWLLLCILSGPVAAYYVGRLVLRNKTSSAPLLVLVGAIILTAIYLIPFIGWLLFWVACLVGIGALLIALKRQVRSRPPADRDATPVAMP